MVWSVSSSGYGTITGAGARFCGCSDESSKCAGLGAPSSVRIAHPGKTSKNNRGAGVAEVAISAIPSRHNVMRGLLNRPERRRVL